MPQAVFELGGAGFGVGVVVPRGLPEGFAVGCCEVGFVGEGEGAGAAYGDEVEGALLGGSEGFGGEEEAAGCFYESFCARCEWRCLRFGW